MKVIALDPGVITGYTIGVLQDNVLTLRPGQTRFTHKMLFNQLAFMNPDVIVCESFEYRNRARAGLELISCEYIGVVKLYSAQTKCELKMQTASTGKGHFSDSIIKSMNLWMRGQPHAMDSVRHLLQWFDFGSGFQYQDKHTTVRLGS